MPTFEEPTRCPRCGRRARVFDLTATSITCADCDPAWDLVRHGHRPPFDADHPQYDPGHVDADPPPPRPE